MKETLFEDLKKILRLHQELTLPRAGKPGQTPPSGVTYA